MIKEKNKTLPIHLPASRLENLHECARRDGLKLSQVVGILLSQYEAGRIAIGVSNPIINQT